MFWLSVVAAAIIGIWLFKIVAAKSGIAGLNSFAQGV
jgi:hypothetical protein